MTHLPRHGPRHPGRPRSRRGAAGRRRRRARSSSDGVIVDRGPFARSARPTRTTSVVDLTRRRAAARVRRHPRALPADPGHRRARACRCWTGSTCALPEEARLADVDYAAGGRRRVRRGLAAARARRPRWSSARTSRPRWTRCSSASAARGLRITSGLVVSDRLLRADLLTTPRAARYDEGLALAERWHGKGRLRYAVTPRFSLSRHRALLDACAALLDDVRRRPVHLARQREPGRDRRGRRPVPRARRTTSTPTTATGWSTGAACSRTTCTPPTPSWSVLAAAGASVAHCPTSNSALGSGLFPLAAARRARCAGGARLRRRRRHRLLAAARGAAGLLHAAAARRRRAAADVRPTCSTWPRAAGADALGPGDEVGDLSVGKQFDAVWVRPTAGTTLGPRARARRRRRRRAGEGVRARRRGRRAWGLGRRRPGALSSSSVVDDNPGGQLRFA